MIHYIKTTSEQHVYQALEQAGACTRVYDPADPANQAPADTTETWTPSGAFDWVLDDGVELDMIGMIHVQKCDITIDENGEPQLELFTVEDEETKQQVPDMVPVRMVMPGDVDQPATEPIFENQLTQPAQPATYWTEQDELDLLLPAGTSIGDIKTPAVDAVYELVQIEPARQATYHDLEASLTSPVAYHANIRGITGTQANMLPTIDAPSKPTRVWWS
jgi:hypothetical protein